MPFVRATGPHAVPKSCCARVTSVFLVLIPMLGCFALAGFWMYRAKQALETCQERNTLVMEHALRVGRLILDVNAEREWTVAYVSARTAESQSQAQTELDKARKVTDQSVLDLPFWPGLEVDGRLYRSRQLFLAIVARHRSLVVKGIGGENFVRETQFYTDIIDTLYAWLTRDLSGIGDSDLWKWLLSYTYLLGSINYLGAEQALCTVFYSLICFNSRETLYYANFSFAGENTFRLYRQSYPDPSSRMDGWRTYNHDYFFPKLVECRQEIFKDVDYRRSSFDPSLCDISRRNETRFYDTELVTSQEYAIVEDRIISAVKAGEDQKAYSFLLSCIVLGAISSYYTLIHIIRCVSIKCIRVRRSREASRSHDVMDEDNAEHVALKSKMILMDDIPQQNHTLCKHNDIHTVKVATV